MSQESKQVVVLIFAHKAALGWSEAISLRQCFKVLGSHPIRLVCPEGLDMSEYRNVEPGLMVDFIPAQWLSSLRSYNRLKILPFLYQKYSNYKFMLTYELDAFVFRDELKYWCDEGWDYIGGPWFDGHGNATSDASPILGGNSGFSLRRISTMLRVMHTFKFIRPMGEIFREWRAASKLSVRALWWLLRNLTWRNCFHHRLNGFTDNEDMFWAFAAGKFDGFRMAPYPAASRFSFDCNPQRLFQESGHRLPFGAHKWAGKYLTFWRPFIEAEGFSVPS